MSEQVSQDVANRRRESHVVDRLGPPGDKEAVVRNIIGPRLKERRSALGWTQAFLSDEIFAASGGLWKINQMDVRRFEAQRKIITDRELMIIATALRCTAAWLLSEEGAPEPTAPETTEEP